MTTYKNQPVRVLSRDSDPSCLVWISFIDQPDQDAMVPANELVETK